MLTYIASILKGIFLNDPLMIAFDWDIYSYLLYLVCKFSIQVIFKESTHSTCNHKRFTMVKESD